MSDNTIIDHTSDETIQNVEDTVDTYGDVVPIHVNCFLFDPEPTPELIKMLSTVECKKDIE